MNGMASTREGGTSRSEYWSSLGRLIESRGFSPVVQAEEFQKTRSSSKVSLEPVSLFQAVRLAAGIEMYAVDFADVSFWQWNEVRAFLQSVWSALDEEASIVAGRPIPAVVWGSQQGRRTQEVLGLVEAASRKVKINLVPQIELRPAAYQVVGMGKIDAALVNTCGVIAANLDLAYGDLLAQIVAQDCTDEQALGFLDVKVINGGLDRSRMDSESLIPRELVRAKSVTAEKMGVAVLNFTKFLGILNDNSNLENITDEALLARLIRIAPEPKSSSLAKRLVVAGIQTG